VDDFGGSGGVGPETGKIGEVRHGFVFLCGCKIGSGRGFFRVFGGFLEGIYGFLEVFLKTVFLKLQNQTNQSPSSMVSFLGWVKEASSK